MKKENKKVEPTDDLYPGMTFEQLKDAYESAKQKLAELTQENNDLKEINNHLKNFSHIIQKGNSKEWEQLLPYLNLELLKPEYESKSLDELLKDNCINENGDILPTSLLGQAIVNANLTKLATEEFPKLKSIGTPLYYTSPNNALANALQANDGKKELIGSGPMDVPVLNVGKPSEVTIYVNASLENMDNDKVKLTGKPYTEYDRAVHDAIVSIYEDRLKQHQPAVATADTIFRTMTHKTDQEYVSPQQRGAVTKSIDKMRKNIYIFVDASEEMKRRGIVTNPNGKTQTERHRLVLDNFILSATHIDNISAGGTNVNGYVFSEPLLLTYAKLTKQLITVKGELLDIREVDGKGKLTDISIANTEIRIAIKSYLLRRVEIMRHEKKKALDALRKRKNQTSKNNISQTQTQTNIILFESVFKAVDIKNKNTKTSSREYIFQVLDYWKAIGNIEGYKIRTKNKTIDAVTIII